MTDQRTGGGVVIGVLIVVAVTVAALMARPGLAEQSSTTAPTSTPVAATGHTTEVTVTVRGMAFSPARIEVPAGDRLVITLDNTGDQRHDLVLATGVETGPVAPGSQATVDAGVIGGAVEGWCSLPGHRQMGMVLEIVTVGGGTGTHDSGHDAHAMSADTDSPTMAELMAAADTTDPVPAELPPLTDATEHAYTFTVTESSQDLGGGVTRPLWTYNGGAPGPILHGRIGDTFTITLVNDGSMGHSIDFHAGELAPNEPMRTIEPGESLVYTFTATRAGIWMYHCSTMPMSRHIANGMFGAVVIEPDGLPPVDRSYVLIQSEQYPGAVGESAPDVVAFNGRAFQYDAHPLTATAGDRVRFWVLDAGPDAALSFHVVGTQFDTVWREGGYTVRREDPGTGSQTLALLAAEGGFVELVPPAAGDYAVVNHQMSLAEKGAHATLHVTD